MSIDIERVINAYDSVNALVKAKLYLFIDNSNLNALLQRSNSKKDTNQNYVVQIVKDGVINLVRIFSKHVKNFEQLKYDHKNTLSVLQSKIQNLQNDGQILSRQDQIISQIQTLLRQWRQNTDPIEFYNTKYRKNIKFQIQEKLESLKLPENRSNFRIPQTQIIKIQNDFKKIISQIYQEQCKLDRKFVEERIQLYNYTADALAKIDDSINLNFSTKQICCDNTSFLNEAHQILTRSTNPSDRRLRAYTDSLIDALKRNHSFWFILQQDLQILIQIIEQLTNSAFKTKVSFQQNQGKIDKLLANVSPSIGRLFKSKIIHIFTKSYNSSFCIVNLFLAFKAKLIKRFQFSSKMIEECRQYLSRISKQSSQRSVNFHHFAVADKKFFDDQSKSQKIVSKLIFQSFKQFLQQYYRIVKQNRKSFYLQTRQEIMRQSQSYIVERLIQNEITDFSYSDQPYQNQNKKPRINPNLGYKNQTQARMKKIQKSLNQIQIFNSKTLPQTEKFYSCALGQKLLLHGRLFILPQGIFFESHFNKKNLLFGKTKIFIPKVDIAQTNTKNTLFVFRDTVVVKTNHGVVHFHALGQQKAIINNINEAYFDKEAIIQQNGQVVADVQEFKQFDQTKKISQDVVQKQAQPLDNPVYDAVIKRSKIGAIFRRYFSDDKFSINGKQYKSFKEYSMTLIQAINPTSTVITPPPPPYFMFKNQESSNDYPTSSTRVHNYGKMLPKIPFVSKGGEGKCEQKQTYYWLGPECYIIEVLSTVKGFSLTQNMQVFIKYCFKQKSDGVLVKITSKVKFSKDSSSNNLVKGPTITNVKESINKIMQTIQKCEKGKSKLLSVQPQDKNTAKVQIIQESTQDSSKSVIKNQNKLQITKQQVIYVGVSFLLFYIMSLIIIKMF